MTNEEYRETYAIKANIVWEIYRMVKRDHPMIYAVPGSRDGSPTVRLTTSSHGLDTPRDTIITITETGNLRAHSAMQPLSVYYEVDISDPESLEKVTRWAERMFK